MALAGYPLMTAGRSFQLEGGATMKRHAKLLQTKVKVCKVHPAGRGHFEVVSPSGSTYVVVDTASGLICTCDWAAYHDTRSRPCSHALAVERWFSEAHGRLASFWSTPEDAARQHRRTRRVGTGLWMTERLAR